MTVLIYSYFQSCTLKSFKNLRVVVTITKENDQEKKKKTPRWWQIIYPTTTNHCVVLFYFVCVGRKDRCGQSSQTGSNV